MPCVFIQMEIMKTVSDTIHGIDLTSVMHLDVDIDTYIRHIRPDE